MSQYALLARKVHDTPDRYFLVEAENLSEAHKDFFHTHPGWSIMNSRGASCIFAHTSKFKDCQGDLSVFEGLGGKTVVMCQFHGTEGS